MQATGIDPATAPFRFGFEPGRDRHIGTERGVSVSIRPDQWIQRMAQQQGMIEPFEAAQVRGPVISYGLSSYGYDIRLANDFKRLVDGSGLLDPKEFGDGAFVKVKAEVFDLPPQTFVLGRTVEYFVIPPNVLTLCTGKSSYARCGVLVNVTPFEPGWEGYATLCIANIGPRPVRLHAGEGIAQVLFFESDDPCEVTYADRRGKYQAQQDITPARLG
jgi:dCTP deaminase